LLTEYAVCSVGDTIGIFIYLIVFSIHFCFCFLRSFLFISLFFLGFAYKGENYYFNVIDAKPEKGLKNQKTKMK